MSSFRILGIDPGSRVTGYGVIDMEGERAIHVANGCIRSAGSGLAGRLRAIFNGVGEVIDEYQPVEVAVEMVFMNRNADSALKLGQARGAALVCGVQAELPIFEFTPAQIKQAIVGRGNATKEQVQHMVKVLLCLETLPVSDAADALGAALCRGHSRRSLARMTGIRGIRGNRLV
jgi:crossover junction endodeoxyribonuclease RuvC